MNRPTGDSMPSSPRADARSAEHAPSSSSLPQTIEGAQPCWFGKDGELFGWLHLPTEQTRTCGVVLVYPLGHEYAYVYRTYRHLARRLVSQGFPVLRFDHHGTGESAGNDEHEGRVRAYRDGISFAIDELRARGQVADVALFGVRIGATLATAVAAERGDVDALILLAPSLTGKSYVRELRALGMMGTAKAEHEVRGTAPQEGLPQEAAGFLLTPQTARDLGKLDLLALEAKPARAALLLDRDDIAGDARLLERLRNGGVVAESMAHPGYLAMMNEPMKSVVPDRILDGVVEWMVGQHSSTTPVLVSPSDRPREVLVEAPSGARVKTTAVTFGPPSSPTFGVLTEPLQPNARTRTAIVFLNTSTDPRVGPNRMYVDFGRQWAAEGFTVARFDLSGVGDTPAREGHPENTVYSPQFVGDARASMDFLAQRGVERFVLVGLCSGAYVAYHTAAVDPRATGLVLINAQTFRWHPGDQLDVRTTDFKSPGFYLRAMFRGETWEKVRRGNIFYRGIAVAMVHKAIEEARARVASIVARRRGEKVPELHVAEYLAAICDRGSDVYFLFSENDPGLDHLRAYLQDRALLARPQFHVERIEGPDHTFTRVWARRALYQQLTRHLLKKFG